MWWPRLSVVFVLVGCTSTTFECRNDDQCAERERCLNGVCVFDESTALRPSDCVNGIRDGGESDIDCGGLCGPCADGRACATDSDCDSRVCRLGFCQVPSCFDGVQNGTEHGVDCGVTPCMLCGTNGCPLAPGCADGTDERVVERGQVECWVAGGTTYNPAVCAEGWYPCDSRRSRTDYRKSPRLWVNVWVQSLPGAPDELYYPPSLECFDSRGTCGVNPQVNAMTVVPFDLANGIPNADTVSWLGPAWGCDGEEFDGGCGETKLDGVLCCSENPPTDPCCNELGAQCPSEHGYTCQVEDQVARCLDARGDEWAGGPLPDTASHGCTNGEETGLHAYDDIAACTLAAPAAWSNALDWEACSPGWQVCTVAQLKTRTANRQFTDLELPGGSYHLSENGCGNGVLPRWASNTRVPISDSSAVQPHQVCQLDDSGSGSGLEVQSGEAEPPADLWECGYRRCRAAREPQVERVLCCLTSY